MSSVKHFIVMGVAGCGKSSVSAMLAERVNATVIEADDLHGTENIEKMARGEALDDDDRWPWLSRVAKKMQTSTTPVFTSCSALRRVYRQYLLDNVGSPIGFIHLHTDRDVIAERMSNRTGHFMPLSLLDSQFQLLEPLQSDERGVTVDISQPLDKVVDDAMQYVSANETNR